MNVACWLERTACAWPDRPALALGDDITHDYAAFARQAQAVAGWLADVHGIVAGDRIGLFAGNCIEYLPALYGCWWLGATAVPINAKLHPREAAWILANSGARLCLADGERTNGLSDVAHASANCPVALLADIGRASEEAARRDTGSPGASPQAPGRHGALSRPAGRDGDDVAWLFYTSGTTGRPKGVMISHRNLLHCTLGYLADVQPVEPGDACLHPAPLSHGSGLYNFGYVARGGINVIPRSGGFEPAEIAGLLERWSQSSFFAAPTMVKRLVDHVSVHPLGERARRHLATIVYGGGPMYLADIQQAVTALGPRFAQIYGQGESPMTITVLPRHEIADVTHPRRAQRLASVGRPQLGVEVSIRASGDGAELTAELPVGETGEVCVRGDVVMHGYWNDVPASQRALRGGWLYTGDVGVLDDDGFLTLKDRSKDLVISGGTNIYPREVEEVLLQHPRVSEVAVIGVPDPDWGETVLAYVVLRDAPADAPDPGPMLDAFCIEHIARFKRPKQYRFVAELPKNNYGKVLKTTLRQWAATSAR